MELVLQEEQQMRTIKAKDITKLVRDLCMDANYVLPADVRQSYIDGQKK